MTCPVCAGDRHCHLLAYRHHPAILHPVPPGTDLKQIYTDLEYRYCPDCGHAFQAAYDRGLLEKIYRRHYWSPDAVDVGSTIRVSFMEVYANIRNRLDNAQSVLEIAASSGQMLAAVREAFPGDTYAGFEPNTANAAAAGDKGLNIVNDFFGGETAERGERYDLIYCRHLIEHIFDMDDFFAGIEAASQPGAKLIIETPSLDFHMRTSSHEPFHVEHIHVFSLHSLKVLGERFGWVLSESRTTELGNVIVLFERDVESPVLDIPVPSFAGVGNYDARTRRWKKHLDDNASGRTMLLWGASTYGHFAMNLLDLHPAEILDGNPNKAGHAYVGCDTPIRLAEPVISGLIEKGRDHRYVVVITSSFYREIQATLSGLGWKGGVVALSEIE